MLLSRGKYFSEFPQKQELRIVQKPKRSNPAVHVFYLEAYDQVEKLRTSPSKNIRLIRNSHICLCKLKGTRSLSEF